MTQQEAPRAGWENFFQALGAASKEAKPDTRARLVRDVVRLYTTLRTCQESYLRYRSHPDDENRNEWGEAIDALMITVRALQPTLHLFDPRLFESVSMYLDSEARVYGPRNNTGYLVEHGLYVLETFEGERTQAPGDFSTVIDRLGNFIKSHFTMEEIFDASSEHQSPNH
jgi:hypothetical protein